MKCQKKLSAVLSATAINSKNLVLLVFLATAGFAAPSISATWICVNGNWNNTGCWDWWDYPSDGEDVYLVDTLLFSNKTVNYVNGTYNPSLHNLYIESRIGFPTVLKQEQDGITTNSTYVGIVAGGFGEYHQSGGSHVAGAGRYAESGGLYIGRDAGSQGIYELSGTATLNTFSTTVGYSGLAEFIQTAGSHVTRFLYVGLKTGSDGYYSLSGTASLSVSSSTRIGGSGTGSFTQQGGTFSTYDMVLGDAPGSDGIYRLLTSGSLSTVASIKVGDLGNGRFTHNADTGTVDVGTSLYIGHSSSGNGSYTLRNGNLLVADSTYVGNKGTGEFIQEGGRHGVENELSLGYSAGGEGVYTLSGGDLVAGSSTIGKEGRGTFNQSGGNVYGYAFDGANYIGGLSLTLGDDFGSEGTFNLSGGNLHSYITFVGFNGTGVFNQTGGVHNANWLSINSSSYYHLDGGTLFVPSTIHDTSASYNLINLPEIGIFYAVSGATGNLYIDGGTLIGEDIAVRNLGVGYTSGSNGSHSMSDGFMHAAMEYIGGEGNGVFTQSGGLHDVGGLTLGHATGSNGNYGLSAGNLTTVSTIIGNQGRGDFNQTGGTHDTDSLILGQKSGGEGFYALSSGELTANSVEIGRGGNSEFTQTGGLATISATLRLGNLGVYNLQDGILDVGTVDAAIDDGTGQFNFTGGTLSVDTYIGNLVNNGGILAPGNSPGITTIEGDYSQDINSTLMIELGGLLSGTEYDVLNVTGTASLDGVLDVSLYDWGSGIFAPSEGDVFDILTADTISGEFDLLMLAALGDGLRWELSYMLDDLNIDVLRLSVKSAVPVPPSVWLFGSGILGLVCVARRSRRV